MHKEPYISGGIFFLVWQLIILKALLPITLTKAFLIGIVNSLLFIIVVILIFKTKPIKGGI